MVSWQSFMSLHLKLLDIDHSLTFEESKLRQIEAHALIYLSDLGMVWSSFALLLAPFYYGSPFTVQFARFGLKLFKWLQILSTPSEVKSLQVQFDLTEKLCESSQIQSTPFIADTVGTSRRGPH